MTAMRISVLVTPRCVIDRTSRVQPANLTVVNILSSLYKNSFLAAAASVFGVFIQQQCSQGVKADKSLRVTLGFVLLAASEKYVHTCTHAFTPLCIPSRASPRAPPLTHTRACLSATSCHVQAATAAVQLREHPASGHLVGFVAAVCLHPVSALLLSMVTAPRDHAARAFSLEFAVNLCICRIRQ